MKRCSHQNEEQLHLVMEVYQHSRCSAGMAFPEHFSLPEEEIAGNRAVNSNDSGDANSNVPPVLTKLNL